MEVICVYVREREITLYFTSYIPSRVCACVLHIGYIGLELKVACVSKPTDANVHPLV